MTFILLYSEFDDIANSLILISIVSISYKSSKFEVNKRLEPLTTRQIKMSDPIFLGHKCPQGKVQSVDLTCDVIRKNAPFVLSKL